MPEGLIVKALSGYYYVKPDEAAEDTTVQCRGRGILKQQGVTPLVGDRVIFTHTENGEGVLERIEPRTTALIRPPVANAELAVLLFSVREPDLNLQLLDKFLVHIEHAGLKVLICLTKEDLLQDDVSSKHGTMEQIEQMYKEIGYDVVVTSSVSGLGTEDIKAKLQNKISVFSGQSGVGKSSLLNAMVPELTLETGIISMKLGRGKHTTRHVELISLGNGGYVADTPGFSQLDFLELGVEELSSCFPEFVAYQDQCKFRGCSHLHEPGCQVRQALEENKIKQSRYEHYIHFNQEMNEKKRRY